MIRDGYHWKETSTLDSAELTFIRGERAYPDGAYRVGSNNPRNIYFGNEHVGVMLDPADGPVVVAALNAQLERTAQNRHYGAPERDSDLRREACRDNGPHDDGLHIDQCPDAHHKSNYGADEFHAAICTGPGIPNGFTCSHPSHHSDDYVAPEDEDDGGHYFKDLDAYDQNSVNTRPAGADQ